MEVARSNRFHIGFFGPCNAGKSSLLNALVGQDEAIVSDMAGTTTDVVKKNMEISGVGPCVLLDTAGYDDQSELGLRRVDKTRKEAARVDLAILVLGAYDSQALADVQEWKRHFERAGIPQIYVLNKADLFADATGQAALWADALQMPCLPVSAHQHEGIDTLLARITEALKQKDEIEDLTGNLAQPGDSVLLVMPQDIQAPKGRLILPQVQALRELLDKKCMVMSVTTDKLLPALNMLQQAPKLIITDSQVFDYVYQNKPAESMLTSFSVLFAAYKGDLPYYMEGARQIDALNENSHVLIAECCTHAPLSEDIGRVKIPRMLRKRFGERLRIDHVSGTDFPQDLEGYDLIIQCGACMFNRRYVVSRIDRAKAQNIPMTNYGITIAHLTGILDKIVLTLR